MDRVVFTKNHRRTGRKIYVRAGERNGELYTIWWAYDKNRALTFPSFDAAIAWKLKERLLEKGAEMELVWFPD